MFYSSESHVFSGDCTAVLHAERSMIRIENSLANKPPFRLWSFVLIHGKLVIHFYPSRFLSRLMSIQY